MEETMERHSLGYSVDLHAEEGEEGVEVEGVKGHVLEVVLEKWEVHLVIKDVRLKHGGK